MYRKPTFPFHTRMLVTLSRNGKRIDKGIIGRIWRTGTLIYMEFTSQGFRPGERTYYVLPEQENPSGTKWHKSLKSISGVMSLEQETSYSFEQ